MKVKELIEELSSLDPEKGIWLVYDDYALVGLVPDRRADEEDVQCFKDKGMETGDYLIEAH